MRAPLQGSGTVVRWATPGSGYGLLRATVGRISATRAAAADRGACAAALRDCPPAHRQPWAQLLYTFCDDSGNDVAHLTLQVCMRLWRRPSAAARLMRCAGLGAQHARHRAGAVGGPCAWWLGGRARRHGAAGVPALPGLYRCIFGLPARRRDCGARVSARQAPPRTAVVSRVDTHAPPPPPRQTPAAPRRTWTPLCLCSA